jgi:ribonuclease HII
MKPEVRLKNFYKENTIEAGCDEAGRGCLAGPVFASAVILPIDFYHPLLNDSKQLTENQRYELRPIIEAEAISYAVATVDAAEIDKINILNASFKAMNLAVEKLSKTPEHLIIDGNRFKTQLAIPYKCIIKGDSLYCSIAAASILAKTYRDDFMTQLDAQFPQYQWRKNKGYPTKDHRNAIRMYGINPFHRLSYNLLPAQLELAFFENNSK